MNFEVPGVITINFGGDIVRNGLVQEAYEKAKVMNEIRLKVLELQEIGSLVKVKAGDLLKD